MDKKQKEKIAELVNPIIADQFVLYVKARNYHWNITGPHFYMLHQKFEELYDLLADDIDELAERLRAIDVFAPGSMSEFLRLSTLKEEKANFIPLYNEMAANIASDIETLTKKLKETIPIIQSEFNDEATAGLLIDLIHKYEKFLWMLKSAISK